MVKDKEESRQESKVCSKEVEKLKKRADSELCMRMDREEDVY